MIHSVQVTLIADQEISLLGHNVNVHDLTVLHLDGDGIVRGYSTQSHTVLSAALRSPAPAAPCPICGRVDDNHFHNVNHTAPAAIKKLTSLAQADSDDFFSWLSDEGCTCRMGRPPCRWCTHPGNPKNQDECEDCWEVYESPAVTVTGWRPEWGLVSPNEVMQDGDEGYLSTLDKWHPVHPFLAVGQTVKEDGAPIRRRLTPPALTDAMRLLADKWEALANEAEKHSQSWEMISAYLYCAKELRSAVAAVRGAGGEGG